jgi:hypothetical protein
VFVRRQHGHLSFIIVYVDDVILAADDPKKLKVIEKALVAKYQMKTEPLNWFLGVHITTQPNGLSLNQADYAKAILERASMANCAPTRTPDRVGLKLTKQMSPATKEEKDAMANVPYKQIVGALIYLCTWTRPDIAAALSEVCRFMANPGRQHWTAVKRILRYLKGTLDYGISFSGKYDGLVGYADSDWGNNTDSRKSRTGYMFFTNGPISWESRLQSTVALSTVEAEYLALAAASVCYWANWD